MIQQPIGVRAEFLEDVKTFCLNNGIEWGTVYCECWLDGASGTPKQVKQVEGYVKELENKRNEFRLTKSFWWRLWN